MKTNFINFTAFVLIGVVLPLLGKTHLLFSLQSVVLIIFIGILIFSQPRFSFKEGAKYAEQDKGSMHFILFSSLTVIVVSIGDWAYLQHGAYQSIFVFSGLIIMSLGLLFRVWAIRTLGIFFSTSVMLQKDHRLITKGPYAIVRHPSYTGALLTYIGTGVFFGSWISLMTALILMGFAYQKRIKVEEEAMVKGFGKEYEEYRRKTFRLIPIIW